VLLNLLANLEELFETKAVFRLSGLVCTRHSGSPIYCTSVEFML